MYLTSICSCFVLIYGLIHVTSSAKLPSYLKPCKIDGKLNECALKTGREAIPKIINGDSKLKIPRMDPFDIKVIKIDQGSNSFGLKLEIINSKLIGLRKANFVASRMDLQKRHVEWDFKIPKVEVLGNYKADGKILVLPITGQGKANITLLNLDITYKFDFVLTKKNGKEYIQIPDSTINFNTTRMYIKLENLFNGDKVLGNSMNQFLDENWKEVLNELGDPLIKSLSPIFTLIINNIAKEVPYNEIFVK
ncbi:protein takeout-like [Lycorma delicatula]|uniref:protein takeout-like n=1 Tax=Lycorma delicatula TaxID=130591 RepID=UPI003F50FBEF